MGELDIDLESGVIGKYRILKKLGEGATSEVFLCQDDFHNRQVAIKRVRASALVDAVDGPVYARFFAAEAALVGRLQHPNVVQIYDAVPDPVAPYVVMEYVPGTTLRTYCRADQLLPLELIVELGFKCAMALGYVYRQGLIHRDVKPKNIMINQEGVAKLADMGYPSYADFAALVLEQGPELVMSHLACADEPDHPLNDAQLKAFHAMTDGTGLPRSFAATAC